MGYNRAKQEMRKVVFVIALFAGLALASIGLKASDANEHLKASKTEITNDDGWDYYTTVALYHRIKDDKSTYLDRYNYVKYTVERRSTCGEKEFRVIFDKTPYIVRSSGYDEYPYCFDVPGYGTFYFRM